jgi:hypothetical protein
MAAALPMPSVPPVIKIVFPSNFKCGVAILQDICYEMVQMMGKLLSHYKASWTHHEFKRMLVLRTDVCDMSRVAKAAIL